MPKDTKGVAIRPGYIGYVDERLGIVESDSDLAMPGCEEQFHDGQSLEMGLNGLKPIDTTYENMSQDYVDCPRSDDDSGSIRGKAISSSSVRHPAPVPFGGGRYPQRY